MVAFFNIPIHPLPTHDSLGIGTRADRFATHPGHTAMQCLVDFPSGPGPNIVRWVYQLFLGLQGPLMD